MKSAVTAQSTRSAVCREVLRRCRRNVSDLTLGRPTRYCLFIRDFASVVTSYDPVCACAVILERDERETETGEL